MGLPGDMPQPGRVQPMMARAGPLPPDDGSWALEMKWDGVRVLAFVTDGAVRLTSRSGQDVTPAYPELGALAATLGCQVLLDGEVVALGPDQRPSFEALQRRIHVRSPFAVRQLVSAVPVTYLAFDVLHLDGRSLLAEPYRQRRLLLDGLGLHGQHWQTPPSITGTPAADVLAVARLHGLEGVVSKRLESRYEPGKRSGSWVKTKITHRQEAVVGGWRRGEGGRTGQIGSLLLGVHAPGGLVYAGHVGTGFTQHTLRMLGDRLAPLVRLGSPFAEPLPADHARGAVWVEPALVVEVAFAGWTQAGRMRAPSYQGLRLDKDPALVVREDPGSAPLR